VLTLVGYFKETTKRSLASRSYPKVIFECRFIKKLVYWYM